MPANPTFPKRVSSGSGDFTTEFGMESGRTRLIKSPANGSSYRKYFIITIKMVGVDH